MLMRNHNPDRSSAHLEHFEHDVKEIKRAFKNFLQKVLDNDVRNRVNLEWRIVAATLDRMFFILYVVTMGVALGTIFPWSAGPDAFTD